MCVHTLLTFAATTVGAGNKYGVAGIFCTRAGCLGGYLKGGGHPTCTLLHWHNCEECTFKH